VIEGGKDQKKEPAYGADVLRLWVSSVDYTSDVRLGSNIIKQLVDIRNKIRNTAKNLLGNLHDFNPEKDAVPYEQLPQLDKYMLHRMTEVFQEVTEAFDSFQFFRFFQTVQNFCVVDLSNFYMDIAKDRLYISTPNALRRRSCQTVYWYALENLAKAIAPVLSHLAEDIWQYLPYKTPYKSVFESGWVQLEQSWHNSELAAFWQQLREIRLDVNKVLEQARVEKMIGSSLEAKILLYISDAELLSAIKSLNTGNSNGVDELRYLFITSQVELVDAPEKLQGSKYNLQADQWRIGVLEADGQKCDRCWNYSTHVGENATHPLICERCVAALAGEF
jgi:isoleucyl-tRNA synthetase